MMRQALDVRAIVMPDAIECSPFAWITAFVSTVCLALNMAITTIPAYAFVACWIPFIVWHARSSIAALIENPTIWAYPALALLSTLWSQQPYSTLRTAVELFVTMGFAIICARHLPARHLLSALLCGLGVIAVIAVSVRGFQTDPLTGSVDFVGPFASKNYLAFFIALLWLTSVAVLIDREQSPIFRLVAVLCVIICGPLLILARSATSDLTAFGAIVALFANLGFSRLTVFQRTRVVFAVFVILLPALVLLIVLGDTLQTDVLALLGKDATLTGRTYLWDRAFQLIPQHPWLGQGYQAFWRDGYVEAEALWARFDVHGGFHFHNTAIETTIETGYVGVVILNYYIFSTFVRCVAWSWNTGAVPSSYFVAFVGLLIVRSPVEVDLLEMFTLATFLCVTATYYGFFHRKKSISFSVRSRNWLIPPLSTLARGVKL